ncbi:MAG: arylsulfatase [Opitutaceae bacterium]|nr:arylsulfatase [Opitutaceae bacterium]
MKKTLLTSSLGLAAVSLTAATVAERPNIIYVLADDLGYGDVRCLNPNGKIKTPSIDRLAAQGMIFTDAHSTSAVCTPSRYGIMTGRYNWRTILQKGVLYGYSPPLIKPDQLTVASLLRDNGYTTACIGKWHLGFDWTYLAGTPATDAKNPPVDFSKPIQNGPTTRGFDYFFGISASLDMPPYVYLRNDRATEIPTARLAFQGRPGPAGPAFDPANCVPDFTDEAIRYIEKCARGAGPGAGPGSERKPFFLYFPMPSPHTPIAPAKEFQGRSGINAYADYVMETDAALGRILDTLDRLGVAENTLVIFTSDNGYAPYADYKTLKAAGHEPSAHFRGWKADIWEGGHRIPFVARWPARVKAASTCADPVMLCDFMATCADVLGAKLPDAAAVDSVSILPDLLQTAKSPVHEALVHHSIGGKFSIRQGNWKLELCPGSGGWAAPRDPAAVKAGLPPAQLYDLASDISETTNLIKERPEIAQRLTALLEKYVNDGRSTPGPKQRNDVVVDIFKQESSRP